MRSLRSTWKTSKSPRSCATAAKVWEHLGCMQAPEQSGAFFLLSRYAQHPGRDQGFKRIVCDGGREIESLRVIDAHLGQHLELLGGFYSLGRDAQVERLRKADDGANDRCGLRIPGHGPDEGAVDLQTRDRKPLDVTEGRVARPEVVDLDGHADLAQLRERLN